MDNVKLQIKTSSKKRSILFLFQSLLLLLFTLQLIFKRVKSGPSAKKEGGGKGWKIVGDEKLQLMNVF